MNDMEDGMIREVKPTSADEYFRNATDEEIKERILAWLQQEADS